MCLVIEIIQFIIGLIILIIGKVKFSSELSVTGKRARIIGGMLMAPGPLSFLAGWGLGYLINQNLAPQSAAVTITIGEYGLHFLALVAAVIIVLVSNSSNRASGNSELSPEVENAILSGEVYMEKGLDSLALKEFNTVINGKHKDIRVYRNLAVIYERQGNYSLAIEALQSALIIDPRRDDIHTELGLLYEKVNQTGNAMREWRIALQLNKENKDAIHNLERLSGF